MAQSQGRKDLRAPSDPKTVGSALHAQPVLTAGQHHPDASGLGVRGHWGADGNDEGPQGLLFLLMLSAEVECCTPIPLSFQIKSELGD